MTGESGRHGQVLALPPLTAGEPRMPLEAEPAFARRFSCSTSRRDYGSTSMWSEGYWRDRGMSIGARSRHDRGTGNRWTAAPRWGMLGKPDPGHLHADVHHRPAYPVH